MNFYAQLYAQKGIIFPVLKKAYFMLISFGFLAVFYCNLYKIII